jgi:hypothetical protein
MSYWYIYITWRVKIRRSCQQLYMPLQFSVILCLHLVYLEPRTSQFSFSNFFQSLCPLFVIKFILLIFSIFVTCCREAATCPQSQQCMALKVGPTSQMVCFTLLFLCWSPSLTFLPSLPPAPLGVLPSSPIHPNLAYQRFSHLSSSNPMSLYALPVLTHIAAAWCLDAHAMSLI